MTPAVAALAGAGIGFAAGSVPFAWIVHRIRTGGDLRATGSGNPGATNVYRTSGLLWGAIALGLDAGKGAAAVGLGGLAAGDIGGMAAAVGVVCGHVASPWLDFRGGKGVAPAAGAFAVLAPLATLAAAGVFVTGVAVSGWVSLGSVLAAAALPPLILALGPARPSAVAATIVAVIVAWRHRENFARMRDGTEPRARGDAAPGGGERR
jgi:glycerol-3-phosphate acyltransferase PlsY